MTDKERVVAILFWEAKHRKLSEEEKFRLMKLTDEEFGPASDKLARKAYVGFDKAVLQEAIDWIDFLEDERRRCYRELEEHEVEIERLKAQNRGLMEALGRQVWDEMRSSAIEQKKKDSCRRMRCKGIRNLKNIGSSSSLRRPTGLCR